MLICVLSKSIRGLLKLSTKRIYGPLIVNVFIPRLFTSLNTRLAVFIVCLLVLNIVSTSDLLYESLIFRFVDIWF